ncbi:hypothetical protein BCR33DRAFT_750463 [Rhizoclosmatium globosum]|uniref:Uncharacterized protein n=1 Tax=Rhizoclosmatium globosum TaxID=329046 RepID=A0A1Y2ADN2_9FUNG|nr:hypothetical protein BCR33DRAFT_750463 [Rhizoclosmatium globosum]|eukprot:ORY20377.1 hypothetical protein BCR33DRAFT_750463 [Rhizoclosmatium globosum]
MASLLPPVAHGSSTQSLSSQDAAQSRNSSATPVYTDPLLLNAHNALTKASVAVKRLREVNEDLQLIGVAEAAIDMFKVLLDYEARNTELGFLTAGFLKKMKTSVDDIPGKQDSPLTFEKLCNRGLGKAFHTSIGNNGMYPTLLASQNSLRTFLIGLNSEDFNPDREAVWQEVHAQAVPNELLKLASEQRSLITTRVRGKAPGFFGIDSSAVISTSSNQQEIDNFVKLDTVIKARDALDDNTKVKEFLAACRHGKGNSKVDLLPCEQAFAYAVVSLWLDGKHTVTESEAKPLMTDYMTKFKLGTAPIAFAPTASVNVAPQGNASIFANLFA